MQVFGLPSHIIRAGKLASRLAAKSPNNVAGSRRAAVSRWRQAMADGLSAERATKAVGVPARPDRTALHHVIERLAAAAPGRLWLALSMTHAPWTSSTCMC